MVVAVLLENFLMATEAEKSRQEATVRKQLKHNTNKVTGMG